ncbi:uncharacterized protein LOC134791612 [Cydia splendana]|uniref:uncharacterized protein LOC134791612 n=1 Tax=Cydia splendana TaxID=1100963 RepID=UPI00300CB3BE
MANIASQEELFSQIKRLLTNHKKTSSTRYTASYLKIRIESLEEYWNQFLTEHREILKSSVSVDEKKELKALYNDVEDFYMEFKTSLLELTESVTIQEGASPQVPHASQPQVVTKSKLPPINLPSFSGDYQEWMHFKDLFISMVHNEPGLSDIHKHHYLRSSLKGEAEQVVRHFELTVANYAKAWNALVCRYSNDRVIANTILNRLLNQKKLTYECSKGLKDLLDTTNQCLSSLANLKIDTTTWDSIIVHIVVSKLDSETHKAWEQSLGSSIELPTYKKLTSYLEGRFRAMEMVQATQKKDKKETTLQLATAPKIKNVRSFTAEVDTECTYCKKSHYICHCTEFTQLNIDERKEFVKNNNLCFNCLVKGHSIRNCRQATTCKTCNRKHHTLLHYQSIAANTVTMETPTEPEDTQIKELTSLKVSQKGKKVILATAQIYLKDSSGSLVQLRALIDQGSEGTFITESAVQLLRLKKTFQPANITGLENQASLPRHVVNLDIYSPIDTHYVMQVDAHVLSKINSWLPSKEFDISQWPALSQLQLADPHMQSPGPIDVLLGAEVYAFILLDGLHKYNDDKLIAQNSKLGWFVSGASKSRSDLPPHNIVAHHALIEVDQLLRKFWETEEYKPHEKPMTHLETQCEEHYKETHTRQEDGRYVVRLPFKDDHEKNLGDSRQIAQQRLMHMEKRFANKPKFQKDYADFIDQYQKLNHLEDVDPQHKPTHKVYHLPHHAVIRESSSTTKLRVVFDGTAQPSNGSSLNDELLIGPSLLQDLRDLIIRWRTHKICLLADVKQMYRQILVAKEDVDYQRILWRSSPQDEIVEKRLLTVTYGTSCAPFLAIRTLKQLAQDEKEGFPDLVEVISNDFYMDDLLTGANDMEQATKLQSRITQAMANGKFEMHKWASNSPDVLKNIPSAQKTNQPSVEIKLDDTIKALGIKWNSHHDVFELKVDILEPTERFTKTSVLSDIAKSYDPLGFLGPVIITAKMFLQKLWLSGIVTL